MQAGSEQQLSVATYDVAHFDQARMANSEHLLPELARVLRTRRAAEWQELLNAALVPAGPIHDFASLTQDPQVQHRTRIGVLEDEGGRSVPYVANPIRFFDTPISYERLPPVLDEQRLEILAHWCRNEFS